MKNRKIYSKEFIRNLSRKDAEQRR